MKRLLCMFLILVLGLSVIGCSKNDSSSDADCEPLEFEIMDENDVSQKIKEKMFEKKDEPYFFTYGDKKDMFIAIGYGAMPTGGYSIKIESVELCGDKIIIKSELIAPSKEEVVTTAISYPGIILKIDATDAKVEVHAK